MMTTLENTISILKYLPESDLTEIQNYARKLIRRREANCPFPLKSREEIYEELENARQQITAGEYQDAGEFLTEVRKEYGI